MLDFKRESGDYGHSLIIVVTLLTVATVAGCRDTPALFD